MQTAIAGDYSELNYSVLSQNIQVQRLPRYNIGYLFDAFIKIFNGGVIDFENDIAQLNPSFSRWTPIDNVTYLETLRSQCFGYFVIKKDRYSAYSQPASHGAAIAQNVS